MRYPSEPIEIPATLPGSQKASLLAQHSRRLEGSSRHVKQDRLLGLDGGTLEAT